MKKSLKWMFIVFVMPVFALASEAGAPITLTASDGTGLVMKKLEARVALEGFLAFTELEMVFSNPENRRREGRFQIVLPQNATISRFAMKIGDYLQEGEVVERKAARRAYEDFLHRRQDPALLETDKGNRFSARVFPIEPKAEKTIILSYSQRLEREEVDYVLPLRGLPQLETLHIKVFLDRQSLGQKETRGELVGELTQRNLLTVEKHKYQPKDNFHLPVKLDAQSGVALRSDDIIAIRTIPFVESKKVKALEKPESMVVLVDTSASAAPYLSNVMTQLRLLQKTMNWSALDIYAFDQEAVYLGNAKDSVEQLRLITALKHRQGLGASDLGRAFDLLAKRNGKTSRLMIISDCVTTAGEEDVAALVKKLEKSNWLARVDVVSPSYHHESELAQDLVAVGKRPGTFSLMNLGSNKIESRLTSQVHHGLTVKVPGADWIWPERVDSILPGEAIIVFAKQKKKGATTLMIGDRTLSFQEKETNSILLKREWVGARLRRLLEKEQETQDEDLQNAMHSEAIHLSITQRVLCAYTALLVLETEGDYQRFNIDRRALADIMTIGSDGIEVIKRAGRDAPPRPPLFFSRPMRRDNLHRGGGEPKAIQTLNSAQFGSQGMDALSEGIVLGEPQMDSVPDQIEMKSRRFRRHSVQDRARGLAAPNRIMVPSSGHEEREERRQSRKTERLSPWTGKYAVFRQMLDQGQMKSAHKFVQEWRTHAYGDVMALIAWGDYFEKRNQPKQAARAYASLIDYFPGRADIRRWAAERLLATGGAIDLVVDILEKALKQRVDHPSGHYLLAIGYWEKRAFVEAIETLDRALEIEFDRRFQEVHIILKELQSLMLSHLKQKQILAKLFPKRQFDFDIVKERQLRFVLLWETDANDVDFHVYDRKNNHASYRQMRLSSGGRLYDDLRQGYGPECFMVKNPEAFPYRLEAHYYNMGPMGYGMGLLHILDFGQNARLKHEFRPFVVMQNQAFVKLGVVTK